MVNNPYKFSVFRDVKNVNIRKCQKFYLNTYKKADFFVSLSSRKQRYRGNEAIFTTKWQKWPKYVVGHKILFGKSEKSPHLCIVILKTIFLP